MEITTQHFGTLVRPGQAPELIECPNAHAIKRWIKRTVEQEAHSNPDEAQRAVGTFACAGCIIGYIESKGGTVAFCTADPQPPNTLLGTDDDLMPKIDPDGADDVIPGLDLFHDPADITRIDDTLSPPSELLRILKP